MRNLKKILALVLALVMSLSLMATASAADTTAAETVSKYQTAVDVLKGIGVVKGDDRGDRLSDNITRAEVTALLYRIATADVADAQTSIHTGVSFTDVNIGDWYTGYISYCYIAEIIKGNPNGTFEPNDPINGYATLAMILRAMGYGKNGEFEGVGWEIQTASTAKQIGILNGITDTQLSGPATRELVFEILFRALLKSEVKFSAFYPNNYEPLNTTLGQRMFGLEEITGVIRANEWASLDEDSVLDAGETEMLVTAVTPENENTVAKVGKTITLKVSTALEDVGLREKAYMYGLGNTKTVLQTLDATDLNTVADNEGKGVNTNVLTQDYATIQKLADTEGISLNNKSVEEDENATRYYINYTEADKTLIGYQSDWVIRYAIAVDSVNDNTVWKAYFDAKLKADGTPADDDLEIRNINVTYTDANGDAQKRTVKCYVLRIPRYTDILFNSVDWDIISEIFETADRVGDNTIDATGALRDYIVGEVYAGTSSMDDRSDKMSQNQFVDEFLTTEVYSTNYDWCAKGDSLRVIDNNNDGTADLVLRVDYVQTKAVDVYKDELAFNGNGAEKLNVLTQSYPGLRMADYTDNNLSNPDELSKDNLGVIVNYTIIDGKLTIKKAPTLTEVIKSKSYKDWTVTTEETNSVLGQSGILNCTKLPQFNQAMDEKVLYNIYLDEYENVRSYELANGPAYALLTEMYPENSQNWTYIKTARQIAELKIQENDITEKYVVKNSNNPFFSDYAWTSRTQGYNVFSTLPNYLQPATAHLDVNASIVMPTSWSGDPFGLTPLVLGDDVVNTGYFNVEGAATSTQYRYQGANATATSAWNRNVYALNPDGVSSTGATTTNGALPGVFLWGPTKDYPATPGDVTDDERNFSFTNVAKYVEDGEEVILSSASELFQDVYGNYRYRAASDITLADGTEFDTLYQSKTAQGWMDWYNANKTGADTDTASVWFRNQINAGTIYNIYEYDYVQLTGAHNADNTHFTISGEYAGKYYALANEYVNTVDSTEFYVVTPSGIIYKQGFKAFTSDVAFELSSVRAAYAVAKNTSADSNLQDYWVADVVVIEVDGLTNTFDSVALMYYNPYETSGNTQFVNSLEANWRALKEADPDLEIVPKNITAWQNNSWTPAGYRFYEIYDQDLVSEGVLEAGSVSPIVWGQYNAHGIYAGIAYRENALVDGGNYIDVRYLGINANSGANYSTRVFVRHTDSDGTTWSTPIYRLERDQWGRTTAKEISLTDWDVTNNADTGDRVIVVYDGNSYMTGRAAYIITLGTVGTQTRSTGWYNPSWLVTLWSDIISEQNYGKDIGLTAAVTRATAVAAALTDPTNLAKVLAALGDLNVSSIQELLDVLEGYQDSMKDEYGNTINGATLTSIENAIAALNTAIDALSTEGGLNAEAKAEIDAIRKNGEIYTAADKYADSLKEKFEDEENEVAANTAIDGALADIWTGLTGGTPTIDTTKDATDMIDQALEDAEIEVPGEGTEDPTDPTEPEDGETVTFKTLNKGVELLTETSVKVGEPMTAKLELEVEAGYEFGASANDYTVMQGNSEILVKTVTRASGDNGANTKVTLTFSTATIITADTVTISADLTEKVAKTVKVVATGGPADKGTTAGITVEPAVVYGGDTLTTLVLTNLPVNYTVAVGNVTDDGNTETATNTATADKITITLTGGITVDTTGDFVVNLTLTETVPVAINEVDGVKVTSTTTSYNKSGSVPTSLSITVPQGYKLDAGETVVKVGTGTATSVSVTSSGVGSCTLSWTNPASAEGAIEITPALKAAVKVEMAAGSNLVASTSPATLYEGDTITDDTTLVVTLNDQYDTAKFVMPETVKVTMDGKTWDADVNGSTGALTLKATDGVAAPTTVAGNITIAGIALRKITITVVDSNSSKLELKTPDSTAQGKLGIGSAMPAQFVIGLKGGQSATLPATATISMAGDSTVYQATVDSTTGALTVTTTGGLPETITGNITITATSVG